MATLIDITRTRGDTQRIVLVISDKATGQPVNIAAWTSFKMSVDPSKTPEDDSAMLEQMNGTILSGGLDGRVYFVPAGTIPAGKYFYDAQAVDSNGEKYTFAAGKYNVIQDITK